MDMDYEVSKFPTSSNILLPTNHKNTHSEEGQAGFVWGGHITNLLTYFNFSLAFVSTICCNQ